MTNVIYAIYDIIAIRWLQWARLVVAGGHSGRRDVDRTLLRVWLVCGVRNDECYQLLKHKQNIKHWYMYARSEEYPINKVEHAKEANFRSIWPWSRESSHRPLHTAIVQGLSMWEACELASFGHREKNFAQAEDKKNVRFFFPLQKMFNCFSVVLSISISLSLFPFFCLFFFLSLFLLVSNSLSFNLSLSLSVSFLPLYHTNTHAHKNKH